MTKYNPVEDMSDSQKGDLRQWEKAVCNRAQVRQWMLIAGAEKVIAGQCLTVTKLLADPDPDFRIIEGALVDALSACREAMEGV